jgi:sec-independent protein translocase protein TatC
MWGKKTSGPLFPPFLSLYCIPSETTSHQKSSHCFFSPPPSLLSLLLHHRILFAYEILTPAALNFFVNYADGAVESLWSIDQYFEFVLVLLLSTGLSFQVQRLLLAEYLSG